MKHRISRLRKLVNKLLGIRSPSEDMLDFSERHVWNDEEMKRWLDELEWQRDSAILHFDRPCNEDGTPATTLCNVTVEWEDDKTCSMLGKRYREIEEAI